MPVLFYIHGGAHVFGNPRNWPFDHWVHQSPNVVIVSIYYRLDSLGFLAAPQFTSEGVGDANVALYDQIEALKWVQKHIDAFGGDPGKVTINGQSASARSVELHLLAKESRGLFSQAIVQSVFRTPMPTLEQQKVCIRSRVRRGSFIDDRLSYVSPCSITTRIRLDVCPTQQRRQWLAFVGWMSVCCLVRRTR